MPKSRLTHAALLQKKLRVQFKYPRMLEAALQHPSYRFEHPDGKLEDFDRLEFFGDTILNFVVCKRLFNLFPDEDEGMLSRLRSTLVSRKILSRIAKTAGFLRFIRLGENLKRQESYSVEKILADSLEAFLAALFFDKGLPQTESFILKHFESYFDKRRLFRLDPNPKSTLQEISQKNWRKLPSYSWIQISEGFKATVQISPRKKASAIGKTRKDAEEKAARALIKKLRPSPLRRRHKR